MEGYINGIPLSYSDNINIESSNGVIFDNIDLSDDKIKFLYPCLTLEENQEIFVVFNPQSMEFPKSITNGYRAIDTGLLFSKKRLHNQIHSHSQEWEW